MYIRHGALGERGRGVGPHSLSLDKENCPSGRWSALFFHFHALVFSRLDTVSRPIRIALTKEKTRGEGKSDAAHLPTKRGHEPSGRCGDRSCVQMQIHEPSGSCLQPASIPQRADAQSAAPVRFSVAKRKKTFLFLFFFFKRARY